MKSKGYKCLTVLLMTLGMLLILAGVIIPVFLDFEKSRTIQNIWLKPQDYEAWGKIPGDNDVEVIRSFNLFNYSDPDPYLSSAFPIKVAEMGAGSFQEIQTYTDWFYFNDYSINFGQDVPSDYIAYHQNQSFQELDTNPPWGAKVTSFNTAVYGLFYALGRAPPPLYMVPMLFEVTQVFQSDFYIMLVTYAVHQAYFTDLDFLQKWLVSAGLSSQDVLLVLGDRTYGWGSGQWQDLRLWVQAILQTMQGRPAADGALEALDNHFQIAELNALVGSSSMLYQVIEATLADMQSRYGLEAPEDIGDLQWGSGVPLADLPFGLGSFNYTLLQVPSLLNMNATFSFVPEVFCTAALQGILSDFTAFATPLLEYTSGYPKPTLSLLNLNTLGKFFTLYLLGEFQLIYSVFGLEDDQATGMYYYLGQMAQLPVRYNGQVVPTDGYSIMLAKWFSGNMVKETAQLRSDVAWGLASRMLLCQWRSENMDCVSFLTIQGISVPEALGICASDLGWDILSLTTGDQLQLWVQAAHKDRSSKSYITLQGVVGAAGLNAVLSAIRAKTVPLFSEISQHYLCSKDPCTYEELFFRQWGSSEVTSSPPPRLVACGAVPSATFKDWSNNYQLPIEWAAYVSTIDIPAIVASELVNYDSFLNPSIVRLFLNSYFNGDLVATALKFKLPSVELVQGLYRYILKVIPGFQFFSTRTAKEWIVGRTDPFLDYIGNTLPIEKGGYPAAGLAAYQTQIMNVNELESFPYSAIYSGLSDPKRAGQFYMIHGSTKISGFGPSYNPDSPSMFTFQSSRVWDYDIVLQGGQGGTFGIYVDKKDKLSIYLDFLKLNAQLVFEQSVNYKGVDCLKYVVDRDILRTADEVAANIRYNQYPNGFNGFLNISSQAPGPTFACLPRCYLCEDAASDMVEYFEFDESSPFSTRIYPDDSSDIFVTVEPLSGLGVSNVLNLQINAWVYNDYFFRVNETQQGKGRYFPSFTIHRSFNFTASQIGGFFKALSTSKDLRKYSFYFGISFGGFFLTLSLLVVAMRYRKRKFGGWVSRGASDEFKRAMSGEYVKPTQNEFKDAESQPQVGWP